MKHRRRRRSIQDPRQKLRSLQDYATSGTKHGHKMMQAKIEHNEWLKLLVSRLEAVGDHEFVTEMTKESSGHFETFDQAIYQYVATMEHIQEQVSELIKNLEDQ